MGLSWFGDAFMRRIDLWYEERAHRAGAAMVQIAKNLVPVDTGLLKSNIYYTFLPKEKLLTLHADTGYAYFVEAGTHVQRPRPYLRPAMNAVGVAFGLKTQIMTGSYLPVNYSPLLIKSHIRPHISAANRKLNVGRVAKSALVHIHMNRQNEALRHTAPTGHKFVMKSSASRLSRLKKSWN